MADFELPKGARLGDVLTPGQMSQQGFQMPAGAQQPPSPQAQPPDIVGQAKEFLTQTPVPGDVPTYIEAPVALAQKIGEFVLPGSVPELGAQLAAFAAGGPAGPAIQQLALKTGIKFTPEIAGAVARILAPAAGGGLGAMSMGQSPSDVLAATKQGATAGLYGEIAGSFPLLVRNAYRTFGHFETAPFNRAVRNEIGPHIANAIGEDLPSLGKATTLNSTRDLDLLTSPKGGKGVLSSEFDKQEAKIIRATNNAPVDIPTDIYTLVGKKPSLAQLAPPGSPAQVLATPPATVKVPMREAIDLLKEARAVAYNKMPPGTAGHPPREMVNNAYDTLLTKIGQYDRGLAKDYRQLRNDWNGFLELKDVLEGRNSDFFPAMKDGGPTINLPLLYNTLRDELPDRTKFQNLFNAFEGTAQAGPMRSKGISLPRVVMGGRGLRVAESVPLPTTFSRIQLTKELEGMMNKFYQQKSANIARRTAIAAVPNVGNSGE